VDGVVYWLELVVGDVWTVWCIGWNKYIIRIVVYFVGYLFITDLINPQKMERVKLVIVVVVVVVVVVVGSSSSSSISTSSNSNNTSMLKCSLVAL
jgi:hypothetical protein